MEEKRLSPEEKAAFVKKMNDGKKAKASTKGRSPNQGVKLLYIRDYLHKHTNKEHPKNANEISEYLASKGIRADRKTIYTDILRLQTEFMEPIEYNPKKCGYYIAKPQFSVYDLQILLDCVRASNFLTTDDVARISKKILELGNIYDCEKIRNVRWLDGNPARPINSELYNLELIQQAIEENRRISFRYFNYYPTHSNRSTNGKTYIESYTGNEIHVVSPKKITHYNGHYVLECYRSDSSMEIITYPVQFLENIVVLTSERECVDVAYVEQEKTPPDSTAPESSEPSLMQIYEKLTEVSCILREKVILIEEELLRRSISSRQKTAVTLLFKNKHAILVLNEFGYDTVLVPVAGTYCSATIRIRRKRQLFNWLFLNRDKVMIHSPDNVIDMYRRYVEAVLHHYDIWGLSNDEIMRRCHAIFDTEKTSDGKVERFKQMFCGENIDESKE